ncbi:YaiI/YqxD family protein [Oceanobacillus kapialis]|uniref:YaiI/YqxD family protein n=1 Tax=Oceanobacillus kapialis TaxID=481353 RepID=UPI00384A6D9A
MKVIVDADACPVKDTVIQIALENETPVTLVSSFAHFSNEQYPDGVESIYVDTGAESADYRIMKLATAGDVIITQDYGLASLGLAKKCHVIHHKGFIYTNDNIDQLLQSRYLSAMERKSGKRTKGPKPFTQEDREKFAALFRQKLMDVKKNS